MRSRGQRAIKPLACPTPSCGQPLGYTDGRRVFVGGPQPTALVTQKVTLCCARPNCGGCVTWHPSRGPRPPETSWGGGEAEGPHGREPVS